MVLVKKLKIFYLLLFGKTGQENVFDDIVERRKAFLDYQNKEFKKLKSWDFSKRVWSNYYNFTSLISLPLRLDA